jgi:hypothetical protein
MTYRQKVLKIYPSAYLGRDGYVYNRIRFGMYDCITPRPHKITDACPYKNSIQSWHGAWTEIQKRMLAKLENDL